VTSKYNDTMTSKYSDNRPITMICRRTSSADNARGGWSEVVKWGGVAGWRECVSGYLLNPLNPYWTTERKTQEPHKAQHNTTRCYDAVTQITGSAIRKTDARRTYARMLT